MKNLKTTIAALICACSLGFQAKAQTTTPASVDILQVGSATITSIDSAYKRADGSTVTYSATNPTPTGNSVPVVFNIGGTIDLNAVAPNEQITLPISVAAGSHFVSPTLSMSPTTIYDNGTPIFSVSPTVNNGVITLTALAGIANFSNAFGFNLTGTGVLYQNSSSTSLMAATSSTFTLDGGSSYVINNPATSLSPANFNTVSISSVASQSNSATAYIILSLYNLYNTYLVNKTAAVNPTDALWTTDLVAVATIPASPDILNVAFGTTPQIGATYVTPNGTSMSTTTYLYSTATFNTVTTLAPDLTMSQIEADLPIGDRAIVKNSDGSYTIAINYGTLLNGNFSYPSSTTVADPASNAVVQAAITAAMDAVSTNMQFQVNFTDPSLKQSATATVIDNISTITTSSTPATLTDNPTNPPQNGQTTVKVHYVDLSGNLLQQLTVSPGGWPSDNTVNQPPNPAWQMPAPATISGYTLVTSSAELTAAAAAIGILTSQIYNDSSSTATVAYPLTAVGNTDVYYIYEPSALPITGLQLTAQPQANNDVILTWGTITEINSKNFTVQRSSDGGNTWVTVSVQPTQAANGNSSVPLTYTAQDIVLQSGEEYEYRVVETDVDGATTTSNVVQIVITGGSAVYPNPANTLLNVKLPAGANNVPFRLISSDGKIVLSGTMTNTGNYGTILVVEIASAVYFLQVTVNNTVQTYEVRIQH